MAYGYINSMRAKPGRRDEVIATMLGGAEGLKAAGCLIYVVGASTEDADTIHVSEVWKSKQHHDDSLELPEAKAAIEAAMPMLAGDFRSIEVNDVGGLGL